MINSREEYERKALCYKPTHAEVIRSLNDEKIADMIMEIINYGDIEVNGKHKTIHSCTREEIIRWLATKI